MSAARLIPLLLASLAALPVAAQDAPSVLRIGMVAAAGAGSAIRGAAEIRRAFTHASGLEARIFVARDMAALVEAQADGRVHYAIYSAAAFAAAQALCSCVEPLVAPVGSHGDTGLRAVVYARRGGPESLEDAVAARVLAGPAGIAGPQVLAVSALTAAGAQTGLVHSETQSAAEAAFARGEADLLVGWEAVAPDEMQVPVAGTSARLAELGMAVSDYSAVWASDIVRYGPHAVRADLPDHVKGGIRTFLLHADRQQPVVYDLLESRHIGGFERVSPEDYRAAGRMVALAAEQALQQSPQGTVELMRGRR